MKTLKSVPLGIFVISAHPHDAAGLTYAELLEAAYELNEFVQLRGDAYAFLAHVYDPDKDRRLLTGEIHKFTDIADRDWENLINRKEATPQDLEDLKIPKHLKPNREVFRFFLFTKEHRIVVQLKGDKREISHAAVVKLLATLFNHSSLKDRFPLVSVTVEQEPNKLDEIFGLSRLDYMEIEVSKPNSDDVDDSEAAWVEKLLAEQSAKRLKVQLDREPESTLKPNEENRKLAKAAVSYGKVKARGRNAKNRPVKIDTSNHPITELFDWDKKARASFFDQMRIAARKLVDKVLPGS